MVTTNIQEIRGLFGQALQKVKELVQGLDATEADLRIAACTLLREAIKVAVPTLKYVDESIELGGKVYRGVRLEDNTVLTREGKIFRSHEGAGASWEETLLVGDVDQVVDMVIKRLTNLGRIFNQALTKMDARREHLRDRSEKLQRAAEVFQR